MALIIIHSGRSVLQDIPNFDLIQRVPMEYMHLVILGKFSFPFCYTLSLINHVICDYIHSVNYCHF